jgi:hypothetical protein
MTRTAPATIILIEDNHLDRSKNLQSAFLVNLSNQMDPWMKAAKEQLRHHVSMESEEEGKNAPQSVSITNTRSFARFARRPIFVIITD